MLIHSPRLLSAVGFRDCVCVMSARLGHLGSHWAGAHAAALHFDGRCSSRGLLRQEQPREPHHHALLARRTLSAGAADDSNGSSPGPPGESAGRIDLILGPMFAGKTSELLRRTDEHEAAGRRVAVVKSTVDNRYHSNRVVSHDGQSKGCFAVHSLAEFRRQAGEEYGAFQVIAIDEAQFLPDLLQFCTHAADVDGKHILLAGLDGDFQRARFGQVLDVVSVADSVTKLAGKCAYCARAALFSLRIAADSRQAVVGGADKYAPVCRRHYRELHQPVALDGDGAEEAGAHAATADGSLASRT